MSIRDLPHDEWPAQLLEIPQPPRQLWLQGTLPTADHKFLVVVGSRAMSAYGRAICQSLITGLAGYPVSIVSGLALGVDACAHQAALDAGLHTLAIPGSGLDPSVLYPRSNRGLAKEILAHGGGLLSEYRPVEPSRPYFFPERNRLMVGLSDAVLVIEAGERSGTLITARLAGEYSRDLLCVPHRVGDPHAFGAHIFIRLGATLVTEPGHILEALRITPREDTVLRTVPSDLSPAERALYDHLCEPFARDDLIRISGVSAGEALTALMTLELRGLAKEEFGMWRRI